MLQNRGLSSQPGLLERVLELKETHCSPYLLAFLFDCYEDALDSSVQKESMEELQETLRKALEVSDYAKLGGRNALFVSKFGVWNDARNNPLWLIFVFRFRF